MSEGDWNAKAPPANRQRAGEKYGLAEAPLGGAREFDAGSDGAMYARLRSAVTYWQRSPVGKELGYRFSVRKFKDKIYLERIK